MKTILVVEDDSIVLRYVTVALSVYEEFRVLGAGNGLEALEVLGRERADAVVTDLHMPVMDGFQFIAEANRRFPGLPILVLTSIPTDHLPRTMAEGALRILAKPVEPAVLAREIRAVTADSPAGVVKGIGLENLLQLLNWERKTCTLTVQASGRLGHIYLKGGTLIHAATEGAEGVEAVFRICSWNGPQVEFVDACRVEPSFSLPTDELLMELALRKDQGHQDAPSGPVGVV
jgi:CheY-like chemotaxis protein